MPSLVANGVDDVVGVGRRFGLGVEVQDEQELVAAAPDGDLARSGRRLKDAADRLHLVADRGPERVVDGLEVVDVEQDDQCSAARRVGAGEVAGLGVPVRESGEGVDVRVPVELLALSQQVPGVSQRRPVVRVRGGQGER